MNTDVATDIWSWYHRSAYRNRRYIGQGFAAHGSRRNVINVMRLLAEDRQVVIHIPADGYVLAGLRTFDVDVLENPIGRTLRIIRCLSNEDRLNFSFLTLKDVYVSRGEQEPALARKLRTYLIIRDGKLHTEEFFASMSQASFTLLQEAGIIHESCTYRRSGCYLVDLRNTPLVPGNWSDPVSMRLTHLLQQERELYAAFEAYNHRARECGLKSMRVFEDREGIPILGGPEEIDADRPVETYHAGCVKITLRRYKPSNYRAVAHQHQVQNLRSYRRKIRRRLTDVRFLIRCITFSMEKSKAQPIAWSEGKWVRDQTRFWQNGTLGDVPLRRSSWTGTFVRS